MTMKSERRHFAGRYFIFKSGLYFIPSANICPYRYLGNHLVTTIYPINTYKTNTKFSPLYINVSSFPSLKILLVPKCITFAKFKNIFSIASPKKVRKSHEILARLQ